VELQQIILCISFCDYDYDYAVHSGFKKLPPSTVSDVGPGTFLRSKGVRPAVSLMNRWFEIPNIWARISPQQGSSRVWTTDRILIAEIQKKSGTI
jgi:hypothetical protein